MVRVILYEMMAFILKPDTSKATLLSTFPQLSAICILDQAKSLLLGANVLQGIDLLLSHSTLNWDNQIFPTLKSILDLLKRKIKIKETKKKSK